MTAAKYLKKPQWLFLRILLIGISLLFILSSKAYAAPDDGLQTPELTWVDISATVPPGFRGSVTVQLLRAEDEEIYSVSAHYINDYKNSIELPVGNYTVERAFTSEDSFIYEAFIDLDSIVLAPGPDAQVLTVEVRYNAAGEGFKPSVPDDSDVPSGDGSEGSETTPDTDQPSSGDEDPDDNDTDTDTDNDTDTDTDNDASGDISQEEPGKKKPHAGMSLLKRLGIILTGSVVFSLMIAGCVYVIRRHYYHD